MAEQAAKQAEAKVERPEVRKVLLTETVMFPGAPLMGGADAKSEVDCEGRTATQRKVAVTLTPLGALVRYNADVKPTQDKPRPEPERAAKLVPWRLIKGVEVSPEWKP